MCICNWTRIINCLYYFSSNKTKKCFYVYFLTHEWMIFQHWTNFLTDLSLNMAYVEKRKVLNICILNVIMGQFDLILSKNHTKKFFFFTSYFYFLDAIVFSIPEKIIRPWNYSITCEKFNFIKIFDSSIKYHFTAYTFLESVFFLKSFLQNSTVIPLI